MYMTYSYIYTKLYPYCLSITRNTSKLSTIHNTFIMVNLLEYASFR